MLPKHRYIYIGITASDSNRLVSLVLRGLGRPNSHLLISPANLQGPQGSRKLDANLSKLAFTCECIFSAHFIGFWAILLSLLAGNYLTSMKTTQKTIGFSLRNYGGKTSGQMSRDLPYKEIVRVYPCVCNHFGGLTIK